MSSEQQSETLAHQRAWAQEAAKRHGWRITHTIEGVASGKEGPRRLLRELLADLRKLEPEARPARVLMIRLDRVGRGSIAESSIVLHDLQQLGVSVFTRDQGDVKLDSAMDELIAAAQLAVARHENEVRRDKMRAVYRRKREAGLVIGNKRPYGLALAEDGTESVDKGAARAVREAFKLRATGAGYHSIALRLAEIAPPQRFKNGKEQVVHWTPTRIKRLLENRAYVGTIVDEVTFAKAQRAARNLSTPERDRDKRRRFPWPLSGSVQCSCGRTLIGMASGRGDRIRYYVCKATWNHDGGFRSIRADALEAAFVKLLERLHATPSLMVTYQQRTTAKPASARANVQELERELRTIDRKREAAWDAHAGGKVSGDDLKERLDRLSAQRDELLHRIAGAKEQLAIAEAGKQRQADVEMLLSRAPELWRRAKEPQQRKLARGIAAAIGGLYIDAAGKLAPGRCVDTAAQRKAHRKEAV